MLITCRIKESLSSINAELMNAVSRNAWTLASFHESSSSKHSSFFSARLQALFWSLIRNSCRFFAVTIIPGVQDLNRYKIHQRSGICGFSHTDLRKHNAFSQTKHSVVRYNLVF